MASRNVRKSHKLSDEQINEFFESPSVVISSGDECSDDNFDSDDDFDSDDSVIDPNWNENEHKSRHMPVSASIQASLNADEKEALQNAKEVRVSEKVCIFFLKLKRNHIIYSSNSYICNVCIYFSILEEKVKSKQRRAKRVYLPPDSIRYDKTNHWCLFRDRSGKKQCRMKGCTSETQAYCSKCEVALCNSSKKNCFFDFHNK